MLGAIGFMAMFTGFAAYDDEGYFLVVLKDYLGGQPLLNPAVPVYGPFFFETMAAVFKVLGLAPGHDAGRWVTLVLWLLTSLGGGLVAFRLTRNLALGVAGQAVTFLVLIALTKEPMSPSALIAMLTVGMAGASTLASTRPRLTAGLIGGIAAALCLIKINVGGFAVLAAVFAWSCCVDARWRRVVMPLMGVAMTALPLALMARLIHLTWVAEFAAGSTLACAGVAVAAWSASPRFVRAPPARWTAALGLAVTAVCLVIAFVGGTTPDNVWNGLFVASFRFPGLFVLPIQLNPAYDAWAGLCFVGSIVFSRLSLPPRAGAWFRIAVGSGSWLTVLLLPASTFLLALPLAWVAATPPNHDRDGVPGYARALLPALAVLEALQAYPVAGTQLSLAALTLVPVGAISLADGFRVLGWGSNGLARAQRWVTTAIAAVTVQFVLLDGFLIQSGYADATPLGLPGASTMRLPAAETADLRALTAAIDEQCSAFITLPGMNSLYLWTRQRPPTDVRSEVWMITLEGTQQQALVAQLRGKRQLCVINDQREIDFWFQGAVVPARPLVVFIQQDFVQSSSFGDYELLTRRQD